MHIIPILFRSAPQQTSYSNGAGQTGYSVLSGSVSSPVARQAAHPTALQGSYDYIGTRRHYKDQTALQASYYNTKPRRNCALKRYALDTNSVLLLLLLFIKHNTY